MPRKKTRKPFTEKQRRFFAVALAYKKGAIKRVKNPDVKRVAKSLPKSELEILASQIPKRKKGR
ncbi:MAG: DUF3008 domain-containing protein [Candidatus Micrarchaeia archaeon]